MLLRKSSTYCNYEKLRHSRFKKKLDVKMRTILPCYFCSKMDGLFDKGA